MGRKECSAPGHANHLRPRHFVQTLEPVAAMEISPVEQRDRTIATIAAILVWWRHDPHHDRLFGEVD